MTFPLSHQGTFCSMRTREIFCFPPCSVRFRFYRLRYAGYPPLSVLTDDAR